jgi:hypothetical protein
MFGMLLSILCIAPINGQESWKKYTAPDKSFSINCPGGIMEYSEKEIITGVGKLTNKVHFLNIEKGHINFLYMVTSVSYPEGTFPHDSLELIESFLLESANSLSESTGCQLQYKLVEMYDEVPNMVLRLYDQKSNTGIKSKVYLYDDTLYTLQAFTTHENKLNDFIDEFINSFKILSLNE